MLPPPRPQVGRGCAPLPKSSLPIRWLSAGEPLLLSLRAWLLLFVSLNSIHTFVSSPFIKLSSIIPFKSAICFLLGPRAIQYESLGSGRHVESLLLPWFSIFFFYCYLQRSSKNHNYKTYKILEGHGTLPAPHNTQKCSSSLPPSNCSLKSKGCGQHTLEPADLIQTPHSHQRGGWPNFQSVLCWPEWV